MSDAPALSSIQSSLEELIQRVTSIADQRDANPEDQVSINLFEVDRSLRAALRQLERVRQQI